MTDEAYPVRCPSTLAGRVRPLTVGDLSKLTGRAGKNRSKDVIGDLIQATWLETTDAGHYRLSEEAGIVVGQPIANWGHILMGDRAFMIYEVRRLTYGDDFYFAIPCRRCRSQIEWHLDLKDLEVTSLSNEAATMLAEAGLNGVLRRTLPKAGKVVGFRLLRGTDQQVIQRAAQQGDGAMGEAGLLARLAEIEGATSPGERRKFIRSMHLLDLDYLREQWEEADIAVQDSIEIECESCGTIQEVTIPTDERFFSQKSTRPKAESRYSG